MAKSKKPTPETSVPEKEYIVFYGEGEYGTFSGLLEAAKQAHTSNDMFLPVYELGENVPKEELQTALRTSEFEEAKADFERAKKRLEQVELKTKKGKK